MILPAALIEALGVAGVFVILVAYALAVVGKLDAKGGWSLFANFAGASLILLSLAHSFNLSATLMEGSWAAVSLFGLVRLWRRALRARTNSK